MPSSSGTSSGRPAGSSGFAPRRRRAGASATARCRSTPVTVRAWRWSARWTTSPAPPPRCCPDRSFHANNPPPPDEADRLEPVRLSTPPIPDWQEQLQASLRRAQDAIARGTTQQEEMVRTWTESLRTAYPDWGRERWQRRLERKLRRRAEREAKIANASLFEGYLWLHGAIVLFIVALSSLPFLWWLIFPAAGLGSRGTRVIARHAGITKPTITVEATPKSGLATQAAAADAQ